jgi:hypothetical protein
MAKSRKEQLAEAILHRANRAPVEPPSSDTINSLLLRASERRRANIDINPPEFDSFDISTVPAARDYTWDDLVVGTDLPTPYYNPEDSVIKLDESQFITSIPKPPTVQPREIPSQKVGEQKAESQKSKKRKYFVPSIELCDEIIPNLLYWMSCSY